MKGSVLAVTVAIGLGLLLTLVGEVRTAPALQAAIPATREEATGQQGLLAQIVVTPTKDNTIYESTAGNSSNGAGDYFFVGKNERSPTIRRGLIAFDLAGKLPAGATLISATLQLQMSKSSAGATAVSLHRLLANWGEGSSNAGGNEGGGGTAATGDATWLHTFFNTTLWQTAGGDFAATASATTTVAGIGFYTWTSPALLADVQSWLETPANNFGWAMRGDEASAGTAKRFDSKENPTVANRPQLTLVYTVAGVETETVYLPLVQK